MPGNPAQGKHLPSCSPTAGCQIQQKYPNQKPSLVPCPTSSHGIVDQSPKGKIKIPRQRNAYVSCRPNLLICAKIYQSITIGLNSEPIFMQSNGHKKLADSSNLPHWKPGLAGKRGEGVILSILHHCIHFFLISGLLCDIVIVDRLVSANFRLAFTNRQRQRIGRGTTYWTRITFEGLIFLAIRRTKSGGLNPGTG